MLLSPVSFESFLAGDDSWFLDSLLCLLDVNNNYDVSSGLRILLTSSSTSYPGLLPIVFDLILDIFGAIICLPVEITRKGTVCAVCYNLHVHFILTNVNVSVKKKN